jgi:SAM-dependent methyltransferase
VFDLIAAYDVIEHLDDVVAIMNEMHRVLVPNGEARIHVPVAGTPDHHIDPTHKRGFHERSFDFFDDETELGAKNGRLYTHRRWRLNSKKREGDGIYFGLTALKPGELSYGGFWPF